MMTCINLIPKGIQYLTQIDGFELPNGILNKEVTGCGATTIALVDKFPTIICSPRNKLLENKHSQYSDTFLLVGGVSTESLKEYISKTENPKILTSYDSFYKLNDLIPDKSNWRVVVDEFHYVLNDASFKADKMFSFLDEVKKYPYVTYLSATPILEDFISKISFFKDIPYYQLVWEEKEVVRVKEMPTNRPVNCICDALSKFMVNPPKIILQNGVEIVSNECVIFINSVTDIVKIVSHLNLQPEDVNIIVASSEENRTLISKLGDKYTLGYIPKKGEPHKKFTFCTSTAYAGCDFYSECATTFVVSDCNRINTSVDIATDLVQIAGRQRLDSNPFRKEIVFIYNEAFKLQLESDFFQQIEKKKEYTKIQIDTNNALVDDDFKILAIKELQAKPNSVKYSHSYLNYNEDSKLFVINELAYLNELYNYQIQRCNYENGVVVRKQLDDSGFSSINNQQPLMYYNEQIKQMFKRQTFPARMKEYCILRQKSDFLSKQKCRIMRENYTELEYYYSVLGFEKIRALSYKQKQLQQAIDNIDKKTLIFNKLSLLLKVGEFISAKDAKALLTTFYSECGIGQTAKGSDLNFWYETRTEVRSINGDKIKGYMIVKIK